MNPHAACRIFTALFALLILSQCRPALNDPLTIPLDSGWRVLSTNDPDFELHADPGATPAAPEFDAMPVWTKYHHLWIQQTVKIPERLRGENIGLYLGKLDCDRVYWNGVQIGSSGRLPPDFFPRWNFDRAYQIPPELIRTDAPNVVTIYAFSIVGIGFKNRPFIARQSVVDDYTMGKRTVAQWAPLASGVVTLLLGAGLLIVVFFLQSRRQPALLFLGVINLLWAVMTPRFYMHSYGIAYTTGENIFGVLLCVATLLVHEFLYRFLNLQGGIVLTVARVQAAIGVFLSLYGFFDPAAPSWALGWQLLPFSLNLLVTQILWFVPILRSLRTNTGEAAPVLLGFLPFIIATVHDVAAITRIIRTDLFWFNYAFPIMLVLLSINFVRRGGAVMRRLEILQKQASRHNAALQSTLNRIRGAVQELESFWQSTRGSTSGLSAEMQNQGQGLQSATSAIEALSSSAKQIAVRTQSLNEVAQSNLSFLQTSASAMQSISEAAQTASALSQSSTAQARESKEGMAHIIRGMQRISQSSKAIQKIAGMMNGISEQTNLLSLNAAIEAARAGEAGRGFAVVAQEIGKLADLSINQSKTIQHQIKETTTNIAQENRIIHESVGVIGKIEDAVESMNTGIETILDLCEGQDLLAESLVHNMNELAAGSKEIARATDEQQRTMSEVSQTVEQLNEVMRNVIAHTRDILSSLEGMDSQIDGLRKIARESID